MSAKQYGLDKSRRLKRKKLIERVFAEGEHAFEYPLKMIYLRTELPSDVPFQVAFGVSRKRFKKAVKRNRVKRLMREAFRLNQGLLPDEPLAIMMLYVGKEEERFATIFEAAKRLFLKTFNQLSDGTA